MWKLPAQQGEGSSSWGGCRLEIEEEQRIFAIPALCSVKRKIPTAGSAGKKMESEYKQSARCGPQEMSGGLSCDLRTVGDQLPFGGACMFRKTMPWRPLICDMFPRVALLAWSSPGICLVGQPQGRAKKMLQRLKTQCLQVHSGARHKLWSFLVVVSSRWR